MLQKYLIMMFMFAMVQVNLPDAMAADVEDSRHFVDSIGTHVLGVLNTPDTNKNQQQKQLQQLFSENVDIPWMGQFVLGHAWQQASTEQRARYMQAYQQYLLAHYTKNFSDYGGSKYKITDAHDDGDGKYSVNMEINTANEEQKTLAGYQLNTGKNGQLKIIDIIIEGVSLITTERSEFSSVVQQGGMDLLINDLVNKSQVEKQKS